MAIAKTDKPLAGRVAVVAGATRGAGRGIAMALGAAGAKVYCSGRSAGGVAATQGRPETLEETASLIEEAGGSAVAVRTDHTRSEEIGALFARVKADEGRLDVLVNDVWGGDDLIDWGAKFWTVDEAAARTLAERSILSHWLTAKAAAPMMVEAGRGLIVGVTDGEMPGYRGQWLYDWVKSSVVRMNYAFAWDLAGTGVTALTVTPGFLRSEHVLEHFKVTEASWREGIARDPFFAHSETPLFIGRGIAALAADPQVGAKAGQLFVAWQLAEAYGFTDIDGSTPRFWPSVDAWLDDRAAAGGEPDDHELWIGRSRYAMIHLVPGRRTQAEGLARRYRLEGLAGGLLPTGP